MAELTTNKNYLQPTGFRVIISRQDYPNLEYFAQGVSHPGSTVSPLELGTPRITSIPLAGDKITYGSLSMDIILDESMVSYKEMQGWLEDTINLNQSSNTDASFSPYRDIAVSILTSHNNSNVQIHYKDCIPTNISAIQLTANTSTVQFLTFNVEFRFSSFELK
jgi:hypothetical protein